MSHERSRTVEIDGRYYNVDGRTGRPLPRAFPWEQDAYDTLAEAVDAARRRSAATDDLGDLSGSLGLTTESRGRFAAPDEAEAAMPEFGDLGDLVEREPRPPGMAEWPGPIEQWRGHARSLERESLSSAQPEGEVRPPAYWNGTRFPLRVLPVPRRSPMPVVPPGRLGLPRAGWPA